MKLIIKDYLSMMKESGELDEILPNLLLSIGIKPISKAQVGVRQFGVDIAAVGEDKKDRVKKLFLFTVKQGDVGRTDWDSGTQAVRPSLEEIKDVYIQTHIEPEYKKLPIKIVLCSGGIIRQDTQMTWSNYAKGNTVENKLEYVFWGGDELALMIEESLFYEHIVPEDVRRKLRKTLALIGEPDYEMSDYYSMLDDILFTQGLGNESVKKIQKKLILINLTLNIILTWSRDIKNLKPALISSERAILNIWGFLNERNLFSKTSLMKIFTDILKTYHIVSREYFMKLNPLLTIENGLSFSTNHFILESKTLFEQLGILSLYGVNVLYDGVLNKNKETISYGEAVSKQIKSMINNHKTLLNPVLDSHIIDISLTLLLLEGYGDLKFVDKWINDMLRHIEFADMSSGKYIPISSDSIEDLVEFNILETKTKEEVLNTSILLPVLAQWCVTLGLIENYKYIVKISKDVYNNSTLQVWYPDEETEKHMYQTNAAFKGGLSDAPINIPNNIREYAEQINKVQNMNKAYMDFSFVKKGFPIISLISSRHFRMPILPVFWQRVEDEERK